MKTLIDNLNSSSGYVNVNSILTQVSFDDWNYNNITGQLLFELSANGSSVKTLGTPINVTGLPFLVFWLFDFTKTSDSDLTFTIYGDSTQVNFPLDKFLNKYYEFPNPFQQITGFGFSSTNGISFIVQGLFAFKDDFPTDLRIGVVDYIRNLIDSDSSLVNTIGTASPVLGNNFILISALPKFVDKNVVVKFGNEIHQIEKIESIANTYKIYFNQNYSGRLVLANGTNITVSVYYPVLNNPNDIENSDPAISIEDGFEPKRDLSKSFPVGNEELFAIDSDSQLYYRDVVGRFLYKLSCYATCREQGFKNDFTKIFKKMSGYKKFFYNGKTHVFFASNMSEQQFENNTSVLRIELEIEISEYEYQNVYPVLNLNTITVTPQEVV